MDTRDTLYSKSLIDFRKLLIYIFILVLGMFPSFQDSTAFSSAILIQAACNMDGFWDFIGDKSIKIVLRIIIAVLTTLSALGILLSILNLIDSTRIFDSPTQGLMWRFISLITVTLPIGLIGFDGILNLLIERKQEGKEE